MASFLKIESAADFYDRVMTFWEKARAALQLPFQEVRYEELISEPEEVLRPLLDFLGLPWSSSVLDHQRTAAARGVISTPSYNQVTRRLYSDAAGRWHRFEAFMAPVLPVLEPWASRYGYDC